MKVAYAAALAMPVAVAQHPALPGAMASQADTAEVRGSVVDRADVPLVNVVVRLEQAKLMHEVKTVKDGTFVISSVKVGSFHLSVWLEGVEVSHQQVVLLAGKTATVKLRLTERVEVGASGVVVGTVSVPLTDRKLSQ
jgi:hypothetical protein